MTVTDHVDDLVTAGIAELGRLMRRGTVSPLEVLDAFLDRIERHDGLVRSFLTLDTERARAAARRAGEELRAGDDRGPFHGIPFALKDNIDTAGLRTTSHSLQDLERVPEEDATVFRYLHRAGGVLVGKCATFEYAIGGPAWDLPFPPALNPWNTDHLPGGSSSGSGAAVGARFVPAAVGTDTGGSVRWPASMCGVTGLKPTYGLVSRQGVVPNTYSLDHCGPITVSAEDNAIMLAAMAGPDPADPSSAGRASQDYTRALTGDIKGLRVGVVRNWYAEEAHPEIVAATEAAVQVLAELGAVAEEVDLGALQPYIDCKTLISTAELFAVHERNMRTHPERFSRMLRQRVLGGALMRAEDYLHALQWRTVLACQLLGAFARFDVLVTAGWLELPPRAVPEGSDFFKTLRLITMPFSLAGNPAIAVPSGFSDSGLPLSLQIAGRPFDEATVFRCADAYQRVTDWHRRTPHLN
jgi:aspartyl-tRNA(Asn)/glutamyl-tRNA(Gln) amidotransferase subunit A